MTRFAMRAVGGVAVAGLIGLYGAGGLRAGSPEAPSAGAPVALSASLPIATILIIQDARALEAERARLGLR